jgi:GNAT superfamily N-acetyltransferase
LLPPHLLNIVQVDEREAKWKERFQDPLFEQCACWVADDDGEVIGFALVGPERGSTSQDDRNPPVTHTGNASTGELYAIYVHPRSWNLKAGRDLMQEATRHLRDEGYEEAVVWVLENNDRARRFYGKAGWSPDGGVQDCFFGDEAPEVRYRVTL